MPYYKKKRYHEKLSLISALLILCFAQPDISLLCSLLATAIGYALAFKALQAIPSRQRRFWVSVLFFATIQAVHLSWLTADKYVGGAIYPFLALLLFGLGLQFGLFSLFLTPHTKMSLFHTLALSAFWTILEWSRLFVLSGYPFNPVGLTLTSTLYGMQMASLVGIFGLTFWIFLTNLSFYRGSYKLFCLILLLPYLFGALVVNYHDYQKKKRGEETLSVLLVQTGLRPEEKIHLDPNSPPLSLEAQWEHILSLIAPYQQHKIDAIILSEGQVPYGTSRKMYTRSQVEKVIGSYFPEQVQHPNEDDNERVGNEFWAQSIANAFNADLIIGLDDAEKLPYIERPRVYNAAFVFTPFEKRVGRYEKRVLVPMGEYIPFQWCKKILSKYGIVDSYQRGQAAHVFCTQQAHYGISICYEEAFGHLMRENRLQKANLLVNLTNDVWYPRSRLPYVHFMHGRLRAIEQGIPLVRSCNSGVTCGVDSVGRMIEALPFESAQQTMIAASCLLEVPTYCYLTLYTYMGDYMIISLSVVLFLSYVIRAVPKNVLKRIYFVSLSD